MVAFTKEEMERANKRLAEINKPYQGLSKAEVKKRKQGERKLEALKKELEGYKMELRTLEIKPQDSQMKIHQLPTDRFHRGHKDSHAQGMKKGQYI